MSLVDGATAIGELVGGHDGVRAGQALAGLQRVAALVQDRQAKRERAARPRPRRRCGTRTASRASYGGWPTMPTSTRAPANVGRPDSGPAKPCPGGGIEDRVPTRIAVAGDVGRAHAQEAAALHDVAAVARRCRRSRRGRHGSSTGPAGRARTRSRARACQSPSRRSRGGRPSKASRTSTSESRQLGVDDERQHGRGGLDEAEAVGRLHAQHVRPSGELGQRVDAGGTARAAHRRGRSESVDRPSRSRTARPRGRRLDGANGGDVRVTGGRPSSPTRAWARIVARIERAVVGGDLVERRPARCRTRRT